MLGKMFFVDRHDAGAELGKLLQPAYAGVNALVLGIPRGGVVVAYEVARALQGELTAVITKKLPHPVEKELAIGACAEDGSVFLTSLAKDIDPASLRSIVKAQHNEIRSRIERFRHGRSLPEMEGRTVIIVDDGIATGSTIVPAIKLCKARKAGKVVVASPVSGERYVFPIDKLADEVVVAVQPIEFYAVGQVYDRFHQLSDSEVTELLDEYAHLKV